MHLGESRNAATAPWYAATAPGNAATAPCYAATASAYAATATGASSRVAVAPPQPSAPYRDEGRTFL